MKSIPRRNHRDAPASNGAGTFRSGGRPQTGSEFGEDGQAAAAYMLELIRPMANLAKVHHMIFLHYLLEMAAIEAAEIQVRNVNPPSRPRQPGRGGER